MELELNQGGTVDTFDRYVYIHGTNHEENLGKPSSSGCLQVSNFNAVELSKEIPVNTHLLILSESPLEI